ncbi:MAG: hypothetical protein KAJ06_06750 [Gammaproteobacteria bacterium]|nr:hypothetical protein [Gammaproteobacteria bacterium]
MKIPIPGSPGVRCIGDIRRYGKRENKGKVGGEMYKFDVEKVNHSLINAIKLVAACRRMLGPKSEAKDNLVDLNRELRESAAACQKLMEVSKADEARFLLNQEIYQSTGT